MNDGVPGGPPAAAGSVPPSAPARRSSTRQRRWLRWAARATLAAGLAVWWFTLGPVTLGGPATFAVVDGISMEPTLQGGDLVVARSQPSYGRGDTIVFPVADGRVVIHRIVDGSAETGWTTQGDNNDRPDAWVLDDDDVLGHYWFEVADVGTVLLWTRSHPLLFGTGVASMVAAIGLFGRVRSRRHRDLVAAMEHGHRSPRLAGRPAAELIALGAAGAATALMTVALAVLGVTDLLDTWPAIGAAVVLVASVGAFVFFTRRLADGWRLPEPTASRYALSARCWEVPHLPAVRWTIDYASRLDLRAVADRHRLPVLRHSDGGGTVTYLTISRDGIGHRWTIPGTTEHTGSVSDRAASRPRHPPPGGS